MHVYIYVFAYSTRVLIIIFIFFLFLGGLNIDIFYEHIRKPKDNFILKKKKEGRENYFSEPSQNNESFQIRKKTA